MHMQVKKNFFSSPYGTPLGTSVYLVEYQMIQPVLRLQISQRGANFKKAPQCVWGCTDEMHQQTGKLCAKGLPVYTQLEFGQKVKCRCFGIRIFQLYFTICIL
jgi:hypothetical protein